MVETVVILALATGISAAVVWWAITPPATGPRVLDRARAALDRLRRRRSAPTGPPADESVSEGFVLLPPDVPVVSPEDDRPPPVLSLLRLAVAIAFVAAVSVGLLALLGILVITQLDQYFTQGG